MSNFIDTHKWIHFIGKDIVLSSSSHKHDSNTHFRSTASSHYKIENCRSDNDEN